MSSGGTIPAIRHRWADVHGARIFYREAPADRTDAPALLLLHGFPSSSHQFRGLMRELGGRFRVVAPDYPGFGHSDAPTSATLGGPFDYSFAHLADVMADFCAQVRLTRFVAYLFDFGGPVGFRLAADHPEWIAGLVVQNANAYDDGLSDMARALVAARPGQPEARVRLDDLFRLPATVAQYLDGVPDPELIDPDGWTIDQHFLDQPGRKQIQRDLAFDYHTNVERYPQWQAWLGDRQPPLLVVWGRHDRFFLEPGAHAYRRDVPDAAVHLLETGHFALESDLERIAALVAVFVPDAWARPAREPRDAGSSQG